MNGRIAHISPKVGRDPYFKSSLTIKSDHRFINKEIPKDIIQHPEANQGLLKDIEPLKVGQVANILNSVQD